ncbi:DUF2125 domain-containing protein [Methylobacterium oxalidis]|uniref:DUF2125 domain-containing protein n=1 Tax=Methylobacterium oxalidis TaxID=944322 RepID=A0A512J2P1_9HYPH|nr:DUF2125 domain-containing protein [Methylobacterium oxalidis]GEP04235.1 hypothetical protein MOX02_22730 [Methylobacterium oxalidis]GJE30674.1 hypothetical protein LDDCCGHA_0843 [Methylobacterium oxalidis]GLS66637.1 hypothetical protein GCM10007888_50200 [Methylobacterium oxalidis]
MVADPELRTEHAAPAKPRSRIGLFLPFGLLLGLVILWSIGWYVIRDRAAREMDGWIAREAAAGRTWTCADRSITGYPFRIELCCASLKLARSDGGFTLGPVTALVQIYQPRHGLLMAQGPFHVDQGDLSADVTWKSLEGSFHGASNGFVRASLVVDEPKGSVRGAGPDPIEFATQHLELHARPTPGRFESDGAVDVSLRAAQVLLPLIDPLVGSAAPADLSLDATVNRATVLRTGPVPQELEAWRRADGSLDLTLLSLAKGDRRLQARGTLDIDDAHRPAGQLELRAAGLEAVVGQIMGQRMGSEKGALIGNLVGQFLGGMRRKGPEGGPDAPADGARGAAEAGLKPLPPLRLADGRLMLGPFPIPNVQLPVLY